MHHLLRRENFAVAFGINHERDAHRLNCLMYPCIRKHKPLVLAMSLTTICLGRFNKVVNAAIAAHPWDIRALAHANAMRNPVDNQRLCSRLPE